MTEAAARSTSLEPLLDQGSDRPFRELIYSLMSLANLMHSNQEHFARYIGVSVPQFAMMVVLADVGTATVSEIASRLEVSSQFVTIQTGKLLEKGLLAKHPNKQDRRSVLLELTAAGTRLIRELGPVRRQTNDRMFRSLTHEQATQLRQIIGTLLADGRSALHELEAPHLRGQRAPSLQLVQRKPRRAVKKGAG